MVRQATQDAQSTVTQPGYGRLQMILQVALSFLVVIYFLPLVWHPAPRALLDARQFITGTVLGAIWSIIDVIISVHR
jgi:hypothetical protein